MRRLFASLLPCARLFAVSCAVSCALLLPGCDQLGIESTTAVSARKEADGKAVGGACRHAGRAIEDCYALNKRADKAAIYAGWREMSEYMQENKLEPLLPVVNADGSDLAGPAAAVAEAADAPSQPPRPAKRKPR